MNQKNLLQLEQGEKAKVIDFDRGFGFRNKLLDIGIRPGKKIRKISQTFLGGPVTIEIDNSKVAIGQKMASRILVEVEVN